MNSPHEEQLEQLLDLVHRLSERLDATERRLARLEQRNGAAEPIPDVPPRQLPVVPVPQVEPPAFTASKPATEPAWTASAESRMGLTWVNRIGVITLVLGAAFFFRYAVERGWIGPWARIALGTGAGLLAIATAERVWRSGQRVYAQGITGAGIALLFLAFYASFGLYRLAL